MTAKLFVMGAHSRTGHLLRGPLGDLPIVWQARKGADVDWSLADGPGALAPAMAGAGTVLCLAGATPGADDYGLNTDIALAGIAAAAAAGVGRVWLASSMAVYGPGGPHAEDAALAPLPGYGASKRDMERAAARAGEAAGIAVTALRLGNIVGADMLFRNIAAGRAVAVDQFPDGTTPRRSYIDPESLGAVLRGLLAAGPLPGALNVAAAPPVEMGALADAAGVAWTPRPAPGAALPLVSMDMARLAALLPVPQRDAAALVAGLRRAEARA